MKPYNELVETFKGLYEEEYNKLKVLVDNIETGVLKVEGLAHLSGSWSESKVEDITPDDITLEITYGIQEGDKEERYRQHFYINRKTMEVMKD